MSQTGSEFLVNDDITSGSINKVTGSLFEYKPSYPSSFLPLSLSMRECVYASHSLLCHFLLSLFFPLSLLLNFLISPLICLKRESSECVATVRYVLGSTPSRNYRNRRSGSRLDLDVPAHTSST